MNDSQQPLILVVYDEPEVLGEVAAATTAAGYACHGCATGEAAEEFAQRHLPDLIILDVQLGGQSGLALCERLKSAPALRRVPVMFLSRSQVPDIIRRNDTVGGTYYLRKPLDPRVLVELIDMLTSAAGTREFLADPNLMVPCEVIHGNANDRGVGPQEMCPL